MNSLQPATADSSRCIRDLASKGLAEMKAAEEDDYGSRKTLAVGERYTQAIEHDPQATAAEKLISSTLAKSRSTLSYSDTAVSAYETTFKVLASGVSGPVGQVLASLGRTLAGQGNSETEQQKVGAVWAEAIRQNGQPLEQLVAATLLHSNAQASYSSTAASTYDQAFKQLAGGVSGQTGRVLATMAIQVTDLGATETEQSKMASVWTQALRQNGQPLEQLMATASQEACAASLYASSAFAFQRLAFDTVKGGLKDSPERLLAGFGKRALEEASTETEQMRVGARILPMITSSAVDPMLKTLSQVAEKVTGAGLSYNSTIAGAQNAAFKMILSPPKGDVESVLAAYGLAVADECSIEREKAVVGATILSEVASRTHNPVVQALIDGARSASAVTLYQDTSSQLLTGTVERIKNGVGKDTAEKALCRLGRLAQDAAGTDRESFQMGEKLLQEIDQKTNDPQIKKMVAYGLQWSAAPVDEAIETHKELFESIRKGNLTVPTRPVTVRSPGTGQSMPAIQLDIKTPTVDDKAPPELQLADLEACVSHNNALISQLDQAAKDRVGTLKGLQDKLQEMTRRSHDIEQQMEPLAKRSQFLGNVIQKAGWVALGGILGGALLNPALNVLGMAGGAVFALATGVKLLGTDRKLRGLSHESQKLLFDAEQVRFEIATGGSASGAYTQAQEKVEKLNKDLQGRLTILRMAVAPPAPDLAGTNQGIAVEDEAITIGGIRIPKKAAPQS